MRRQNPVEVALPAQRAVDQFGGERRVARGHSARRQLGVESEIRKSVVREDPLEGARGGRTGGGGRWARRRHNPRSSFVRLERRDGRRQLFESSDRAIWPLRCRRSVGAMSDDLDCLEPCRARAVDVEHRIVAHVNRRRRIAAVGCIVMDCIVVDCIVMDRFVMPCPA